MLEHLHCPSVTCDNQGAGYEQSKHLNSGYTRLKSQIVHYYHAALLIKNAVQDPPVGPDMMRAAAFHPLAATAKQYLSTLPLAFNLWSNLTSEGTVTLGGDHPWTGGGWVIAYSRNFTRYDEYEDGRVTWWPQTACSLYRQCREMSSLKDTALKPCVTCLVTGQLERSKGE